jgi:hypothetical protein
MAIGHSNGLNDYTVTAKEFAIGGKLVAVRCSYSDIDVGNVNRSSESEIKKLLMHQMVEYIMQEGLVEFTKQPNPNGISTTYQARCYLAPDNQVKILRIYGS